MADNRADSTTNSPVGPESSNQPHSSRPATPPTNLAPVSFAPSFLVRTRVVADDAIEESGNAGEEWDVSAPQAHPFPSRSPPFRSPETSPPRKKSKKSGGGGGGALVQRLKQVRDNVRGDVIRLQSGQYPFLATTTRFDVNDPRHRAKSHMDVTLVGEPVLSDLEHEKVVFCVIVHTHHMEGGDTGTTLVPAGCLAWAYFSTATARERNLQPSRELRIYNPVALAVSRPSSTESPPTAGGQTAAEPLTFPVEWIIIATQVCEPYPDVLPRLPDPKALLASFD